MLGAYKEYRYSAAHKSCFQSHGQILRFSGLKSYTLKTQRRVWVWWTNAYTCPTDGSCGEETGSVYQPCQWRSPNCGLSGPDSEGPNQKHCSVASRPGTAGRSRAPGRVVSTVRTDSSTVSQAAASDAGDHHHQCCVIYRKSRLLGYRTHTEDNTCRVTNSDCTDTSIVIVLAALITAVYSLLVCTNEIKRLHTTSYKSLV